MWLRECFWHVLFAFILLIVMIIWRPSANRNRYVYLVHVNVATAASKTILLVGIYLGYYCLAIKVCRLGQGLEQISHVNETTRHKLSC